jgi:3-phosphoshikimate 1-carboxyvinyltransferase
MAHTVTVTPGGAVRGTLVVPGDKSISHRYALLAALAEGTSRLLGYSSGADCRSTLTCLAALGVTSTWDDGQDARPMVAITGVGARGFRASMAPLDCGNSGSTMRMLAGVVAAQPIVSTLVGDRSLSRRPMRRIIEPLSRMGATIEAAEGDRPPLVVRGGRLTGIEFTPAVASAQVKSAVLLAGLRAEGRTRVTEPAPTRDHTERALPAFGVHLDREGTSVALLGGQSLVALDARVPGDISSSAFPAAAACALPGSDMTIEEVGLNPTRTAILDVLRRFGATVESDLTATWQGEPVGRIRVRPGTLGSLTLGPNEVPGVIDELPVLAALATAGGELHVTGASELRVKESDRITALVSGLRALGADADEFPDGFHIRGRRRLSGGVVDAQDDHRLAMAFAVAALAASGPVTITGAAAAAVSYPTFFTDLDRLRT